MSNRRGRCFRARRRTNLRKLRQHDALRAMKRVFDEATDLPAIQRHAVYGLSLGQMNETRKHHLIKGYKEMLKAPSIRIRRAARGG